jgi:hypothetical protein
MLQNIKMSNSRKDWLLIPNTVLPLMNSLARFTKVGLTCNKNCKLLEQNKHVCAEEDVKQIVNKNNLYQKRD